MGRGPVAGRLPAVLSVDMIIIIMRLCSLILSSGKQDTAAPSRRIAWEEARSRCAFFMRIAVWGGLEPGQRIPTSVLISWDFIEPVWLAARF